MKKIITMGISVMVLCFFMAGCGGKSGAGEAGEVNIICWSEYLPDEVITDFEKETGIKVNMTTFNSADEMLAKVQSSAKGTYDMIIAPGVTTAIMAKQGILTELEQTKIPNRKNIDPLYMSTPNDPDNKYSIPYLYTSVVIAVNTDVIKDDIKSYKDLLNPAYKDSIVTIEDARTVVSVAMIAEGYDGNNTSAEALSAAESYLNQLKPNIHAFNGDSPKTLMLNGECPIGLIYGGECALAMDENPAIIGIYPKEGIYFETDMMMKTKDAKNPDNVEPFINYICDAQVSAKISTYFPYINPNKAAKEYLSEDFLNNNIKNIPEEDVKNSKSITDIGDEINKIVDLWTKFKG